MYGYNDCLKLFPVSLPNFLFHYFKCFNHYIRYTGQVRNLKLRSCCIFTLYKNILQQFIISRIIHVRRDSQVTLLTFTHQCTCCHDDLEYIINKTANSCFVIKTKLCKLIFFVHIIPFHSNLSLDLYKIWIEAVFDDFRSN